MYCIACMCLCSQEPYTSDKYITMYYSGKRNAIGVKKKIGKKEQIFQFGGAKCGLDREKLDKYGQECLRKLDAGEDEMNVKQWVQEAIATSAEVL